MPKGKPKQTAEAPKAKPEPAKGKPASKLEGVRWALQKLGNEAKPIQIQSWLKDTFTLDMPVSTITNYKSTLLSKTSKSKAAPKKVGRPAKTTAKAATAPKPAGPVGGINLDDLRAVKAVIDRLGAAKVSQLAQALAK